MATKPKKNKIRGGKPAVCPAGNKSCPICSGIVTVTRIPAP